MNTIASKGSFTEIMEKMIIQQAEQRHFETIKKILIIGRFNNTLVQCNSDFDTIKQLYATFYIFTKIYTFPKDGIKLLDMDLFDYDRLWLDKESVPLDINKHLVADPSTISLLDFDLIILHPAEVENCLQNLSFETEPDVWQNGELPVITLFHDTHKTYSPSNLPKLDEYLLAKTAFCQSDLAKLFHFKRKLSRLYKGFTLEEQEAVHQDLVDKLMVSNKDEIDTDITNIVLLDDQRRRFYIGDTYFWLLNIRKNLLSIFPNANIHIVCRNQLRFQIISKMLNGSWDHNITFEHKQWKQVDYSSYDLVLCDSDTLHDFLPFVKQHMSLFTKKQMYCYINTYIKSIEKFTAFNFKNLYDHHETKRNKVKHLLHLRKQSGLAITAEEHNWATEWLAGKGFDYQDNKLIVFVFNSSQQSKSLREDVMMHLTGHFASIKSYKVLLFDENREGLGHKCAEKLGEALYRNIIIFEGRGLRQAMALMAHPKVDLIIGPCTGLLHLANGVYNYLLNTGQRLRNHIPSLVVYVGDVKEYSTEYHPKDWWRNTLVKCFIFSKVGSFGRFKSLEDFQANGLDFLVDSMELSEASLENFIEIFTHHSLTNRKLLGQLMDTMC